MQMNEQVLTALEVLRNFAENDFEKHRIDVLEKDLTDPPKVEIIDDKHQKFNGIVYHENTKLHYYRVLSLHRVVYQYYYGGIPEEYEIHHDDWNPANNDISNLKMLTKPEHHKIHHQANITVICEHCGKPFVSKTKYARFCSPKCMRANSRKRYQIPAKCEYCGKNFQAHRYEGTRFCSRTCASKWREQQKNIQTEEKPTAICPVCGKEFIKTVHNRIYCSNKCNVKAYKQRSKNQS